MTILRLLVLTASIALLCTGVCSRRLFAGDEPPLVIDATRMINSSLPGDLDAALHPQRVLNVDTQTVAQDGYAKQTHVIAGGSGTHMDSPAHVCGGLWVQCAVPGPYRTIEQARTEELLGPLVIINVKRKAANNPNYMVTVADIQKYINRHGDIPDRAWVVMDSGWSQYAYNEAAYKNIGSDGLNHFPGWSGAAVEWLVNNTNFTGIGVDTLSVDKGESFTYEAHFANMGSDRFAMESIDLSDERIPVKGAWIVLSPSKIQGAPEGSTRALILVRN